MTKRDEDILARTLVGEARGEGAQGMADVACVIANRVTIARAYVLKKGKPHPLFGDGSFASACQAKWQFSCWNADDPNRSIIENLGDDFSIFNEAIQIACDAVAGRLEDRTGGATHYKRIGTSAKWANGLTPCFVEGHHEFFRNVP